MSERIIDACCLINLYASGKEARILQAYGGEYYISAQVRSEALSIRRPDPHDAEKLVLQPIDLSPGMEGGWLKECNLEGEDEFDAFVMFAQKLADGEASCLAIAQSRGWAVATDDRKAIKVCTKDEIAVVTTPDLIKRWSESHAIAPIELAEAIDCIERFACFQPGRSSGLYEWWNSCKGL